MVVVDVRAAREDDYDALEEFDRLRSWPGLCSESSFADECTDYTVAVVEGRVWGFLQGFHDSQGWMACLMNPAPLENWLVSTASFFTVHPNARGHGLASALLGDFMSRSRAAGSQWLMLHPAECGTPGLSAAMRRLCAHAGLRWVEPAEERRRHRPTLLAAPLVDAPDYHFRLATHVPVAQPAQRHRSRPASRARVMAHAA